MRARLLFCLLPLFAAAGCINEGDAPPDQAPGIGELVVFEYGPHLAQCSAVAVTRKQSAARLTGAGIDVRRSSCGYIEGIAHPAVCGAGTGQILLHDIPARDLAAAQAAGFASTDSLPDWRRADCPQYLHAIEIALETTACADLRNRVLQIQSNADPDQRLILLDQAGRCADAGYRQLLFGGEEGDQLLCSIADSFAGPQKSCPVSSRAALFDTVLAHLDQPDLGLGSGYSVTQVHPGS